MCEELHITWSVVFVIVLTRLSQKVGELKVVLALEDNGPISKSVDSLV